MSKEAWFSAWNKLYYGALDDGLPERMAEEVATEGASAHVVNSLLDLADAERQRAKEGQ